ncbi:MAG: hypothetical protein OXI16_02975 [Chloroflexota bacterium]|nr:hypothetical protein [Chloroflexota bacterium]
MANPSVVEAQVRFALSQLPVQNAHHEFEHICRHLTKQFICSNVLPATGPVSAGGDQGRDIETFRSYLREELGRHGAFLGLVSEGAIAFICTTQAGDLLGKLRRDIEKVCSSGHPVNEIRAFTLESVPVAARHRLETETQDSYGIRLEFHDAESISDLLARPEGFWIAEQFLSIPAEIRPEPASVGADISVEYVERRRNWREKGSPNPTLGDFIDLRNGLRDTVFHEETRGDLPFWLGLLRELLADPALPAHIQQRARYEVVVATVRVTRDLRTVDDVVRAYLDQSLTENEPALLDDASTLLMYANGAVQRGLTSLTAAQIRYWNKHLRNRIQELVAQETLHRRASLLHTLGFLGLHPALSENDIQDLSDEAHASEHQAGGGDASTLIDIAKPDNQELTNTSLTLSAWTAVMDSLDETPLFPIQGMADMLQLMLPLWSRHAEWRILLDRVEMVVGERSGKHTLAARARDRAIKLLRAERRLDALEEFHLAKIDWWSGETVRGSMLSMILIARLYLELGLPQASKLYALAVAYIAATRRDEKLVDLIPAGLIMAADADFIAGAWCNALELYELGLVAQQEFIEDGTDWEKHGAVENTITKLAYIEACAKTVDSKLAAAINSITARIGVQDVIEDAVSDLNSQGRHFWESFVDIGLVTRPFADLGKERHIRFSALGTDWTLVSANDIDSRRVVERFAAAAQIMLAALAREDMCLLQTRINVRVEYKVGDKAPVEELIESLPSNDGREWVVQLGPVKDTDGAKSSESDIELLSMLTIILREASLLPNSDFSASLDRAFERGLRHKLTAGRPYDQLVEAFATDAGPEIHRPEYHTPWHCHEGPFWVDNELRWQNGPGPTFSRAKANELLQTRYSNLARSLRITIAMLASSEDFSPIVQELRSRGWLDWHILTAILNIVMNYRFPADPITEEMIQAAYGAESAAAEPVPVGLFSLDNLNNSRQGSLLALLSRWELECHQKTPDIAAIEQLLADRYGYWEDDVPHIDPFPETVLKGVESEIIVLQDVSPQDKA